MERLVHAWLRTLADGDSASALACWDRTHPAAYLLIGDMSMPAFGAQKLAEQIGRMSAARPALHPDLACIEQRALGAGHHLAVVALDGRKALALARETADGLKLYHWADAAFMPLEPLLQEERRAAE